jgi:hypothetical protein
MEGKNTYNHISGPNILTSCFYWLSPEGMDKLVREKLYLLSLRTIHELRITILEDFKFPPSPE